MAESEERRLRRASSASTYALEVGPAVESGGDVVLPAEPTGGAGGPCAVDTDFLDAILDDDDVYRSPGNVKVITKTFKAPEDETMRTFMKQKASVLADLDFIAQKADEARRVTRELEDVYAEDEAKKMQDELQGHFKAGDAKCLRAKKKLNQLKKSSNELRKNPNQRVKAQLQIRNGLQQTLEKRFVEVTRDLQDAKVAYKARLTENITRQVKIADPQATDDEIAEAIESGTAHELIQRTLNRSSLGHKAFQDKATDVAEKSKDIKELEQSMLRLKEMFQDLAQLIEMQSEQLDVVEVTVDQAMDNVDAGNKELEGVVSEQTAIRKRITIILVIVGVCVVGGAIAACVLLI